MPKGYSLLTAEVIRNADSRFLGVQLGRRCVELDIPVKDIAEFFEVSRVAVYSWFKGEAVVSPKHESKMRKLIEKLK
jgi:hypothetical protein